MGVLRMAEEAATGNIGQSSNATISKEG